MTDIAVIIVNWNAREDLRRCLHSLLDAPPPDLDYEVWVVDNASTDNSMAMVQTEFPDVHRIANSDNRGFSKANNQAIEATNSRYVLLLNSDAFIHPGALEALVIFGDTHPKSGILGPKVLNPDGTLQFSCRRWPTLGAGFFRNTYLGRLFPNNKYARDYLMGDVDHNKVMTVDWVSGCAMMVRRTLIDTIGALDERFYMYSEDVDICKRAWDAGYEVVYVPDAVVTHVIGRSSDKNAEKMIIEFHRSWYEYDKKHHPKAGPLRRGIVWSGLALRAGMRIGKRRWNTRRDKKAVPQKNASQRIS